MATTSSQVQELTSSWTNYMDAAKQITSTDNSGSGTVVTPMVANPNGAPVDTTTATTPKVNEITTPTIAEAPIPSVATPEQWLGATTAALSNIGATAISEGASQQELTKQLAQIDKTQASTKIDNAVANQKEFETIQTAQMIDKTANEIEYQKSLQENQQAEISALKLQQTAENAANQAAAADMKVKQENAERELQIANDISIQKSSISFAKLGLSFSGAAINQASQIFTTWMYNLSSLKSWNAKSYADLQVKINSTQFDHIRQIGALVSQTAEKEFASKERLREFIWDTQNNILLSKKEAQNAIQSAITTYKTEAQQREDKLYSDMNSANATLAKATEAITSTLTTSQNNAKTKIDLMVASWQWATLSQEAKNQYEKDAGVAVGTTTRTITTNVTKGINDRIKDLVWSAVNIPSATLQNMQVDVTKYTNMGYGLPTAIQMVVDRYAPQIPEVKAAQTASKTKASLANAKTQAEIDKLISESKENLASIDVAKARLAIAKSWSWGSSGWKIQSFVTSDWMPLKEVGWALYTLDGKVYWTKPWESIKNKESIVDYEAKTSAEMNALAKLSGWDDGLVDIPTVEEDNDIPYVPFF